MQVARIRVRFLPNLHLVDFVVVVVVVSHIPVFACALVGICKIRRINFLTLMRLIASRVYTSNAFAFAFVIPSLLSSSFSFHFEVFLSNQVMMMASNSIRISVQARHDGGVKFHLD
eukprot:GHVT01042027.1.p1 GENE.GHVT01042027.1~~GHVT01042027.1.p1  ORF type:complete len:116 (+),score=6.86 GHVT01042027.1:576-923(+)